MLEVPDRLWQGGSRPRPRRVAAAHEAARIVAASFTTVSNATGGRAGWEDWAVDVIQLADWLLADGEAAA